MNLALENLRVRIAQSWQRRAITLKAASFATVGLINTAVDAAIFFLLLAFVTPSLAVANVSAWFVAVAATTTTVVIAANYMPVWTAKGLAILVSFAVNFTITHFVLFRPRREGV